MDARREFFLPQFPLPEGTTSGHSGRQVRGRISLLPQFSRGYGRWPVTGVS